MIKNILSVVILFLLFSVFSFSQSYNWAWVKGSGGFNTDEVYGITTDIAGNIYATGMFQSSQLDFDGITIYNVAANLGTADIFVVKYDATGHALWARSCGGINNDMGKSIATDPYGNVYVTGNFTSDTLHFADSALANTIVGIDEMMVLKYDANGNEIWAFHAQGVSISNGVGLGMDESGNGYVTGQFTGSMLLGDSLLNSQGIFDIFIARFSNAGKVVWARSFGEYADDFPYNLSLDKWNNVYIAGSFNSDTLAFDNDTLYTAGYYDLFITKFDSLGNVLWAIREGDNGDDAAKGVATDKNGNVYITGAFDSPVITFGSNTFTNAGGFDLFVAKYDSSGLIQWAKNAGHSGYFDWGYNLQCNQSGVYVCGLFMSDTIVFDNIILTNSGNTGTIDMFLAKYDFAGNVMWAMNAIGNKTEEGACIALDPFDNCYMAGGFASNTLTLGPTSIANASITGNGDLFIAKLEAMSVGINEAATDDQIKMFPNPAGNYFYLAADANTSVGNGELTVYNSVGGEVLHQKLSDNFEIQRVDCANLVSGIYTLVLNKGNQVYRGKISKL